METQYALEVAQTILSQLRYTTDRKFMVMSWGFNKPIYGFDSLLGYEAPFLQFRVKGRLFSGRVRVYHNSLDYYTVFFMAVQSDTEKMPRLDDVDCEQLTYAIDRAIENPKGGYKY